jgi:hypothetical protein
MFGGYSAHHAHDVYRMLNFETETIINLRDIIWLNQVHKEWILKEPNNQPNYDDDDGVELMIQSINKDQNAPEDVIDHDELKRIKIYKQMRHLESSFNPDATQVVEQFEQGREILFDHANVALFSGRVINEEPTTFNQAWNHEDPKVRENWRAAINKEFDEMNKKKLWEIIKKKDIPKSRRTI